MGIILKCHLVYHHAIFAESIHMFMDAAGKLYSCIILNSSVPVLHYLLLCPTPPLHLYRPLVLYCSFLPCIVSSVPVVADLMETCIDDAPRAPVVPTVTATEEAGPSNAFASASVSAEDPLSLCEAAARLKQLELESSPLLATPRNNINVNMAMNNQEDVVKLTEKCGLSSAGSSPVVTPLRTPEDLKSNILKAQAEAAVLKGSLEEHVVMAGDKNCNLQEATARLKIRTGRMGSNSSLSVSSRPDTQDSWDLLKPSSLVSSAGTSAERLSEDLNPSVAKMPCEPASEVMAPKVKAEDVDLQTTAPLSDNLIDFTDPTPVLPPVQQPKPLITPRWIIPTTAPPGVFTNGLLDLDPPPKVAPLLPADGGAALTPAFPHLARTRNTSSGSTAGQPPASEDGAKPRGLLTTEL
ncbi:hypothetical protein INR49_025216 [Caranx melampygus]|nr:hypothetical protein INR49_025216 [Caranx melampygus]